MRRGSINPGATAEELYPVAWHLLTDKSKLTLGVMMTAELERELTHRTSDGRPWKMRCSQRRSNGACRSGSRSAILLSTNGLSSQEGQSKSASVSGMAVGAGPPPRSLERLNLIHDPNTTGERSSRGSFFRAAKLAVNSLAAECQTRRSHRPLAPLHFVSLLFCPGREKKL